MSKNDRLALVTGTSSGIGAALVAALLDEEWSVIGMARRQADFDSALYRHLQVDLSNLARLESLLDEQLAPLIDDPRWTRIGLVNNAAVIGALRSLEAIDADQLTRAFAVNAVAPMMLMSIAARVAPPAASLRIVNISTGAAVRAFPGLSDYGASKAALRMAGMIMAEELSSDSRPGGRHHDAAVLSYEPGVVDTAMQVQARAGTGEEAPWNQPFKDFAAQGLLVSPEQVVGEIVSFLSGSADSVFSERRFGDG